jgi:hypothetical protein
MLCSFWHSKIVICGIITDRQHIKAMIELHSVQLTEISKFKIDWVTDIEKFNFWMSVMMTVEGALQRFC